MTVLTADWLSVPATRKVCDALSEGGAQVFFVGGCVRNSLLGAKVSDIDIATRFVTRCRNQARECGEHQGHPNRSGSWHRNLGPGWFGS